MSNNEQMELARAVEAWHKQAVANCKVVIDAPKDVSLRLQMASGEEEIAIEAGTEMAKGVRVGFILAMEQFAKLPFTLTEKNSPESELPMQVTDGGLNPHYVDPAKELAAKLNGTEYPAHKNMSKDLIAEAKAAGLVIVYGASDDLMEFDGAFRDEASCYDGGIAKVDADGLLPARDCIEDDVELERYFNRQVDAHTIEALWCDEPGYSWTFKTDIPHETFEIVEDGEPYCRGIVFALADLK